MKIRRRTKNLILLITITLLLTVSVSIAFNQQPLAQNTLIIPTLPTSTANQNSKMGTNLQELLQTSDLSTECEMIVFFEKTITYTAGISLLKNLGEFEIISNYTILNGICIRAPIKMAETIAQQNCVRSINYNGKVKLTGHQITTNAIYTKDTGANTAIGADILQTTYGLNGTGVVVAVLDTGINPHTYLDSSRIIYNHSYVSGENETDLEGHGTAVAGIIGASGGSVRGVAPAVDFLNLKVLDKNGEGDRNDVITAINEALEDYAPLDPHPKADIISLSLGSLDGNSSDPICIAVNDAWKIHSTIVVAAAGNEGGYGYETINSPGLAAYIITVGAAGGYNYASIPSFSSRGPTDDNRTKPDIVAPGVDLTTLSNDGINTVSFSGTSASTPVVSGAIALLLDDNSGVSSTSPNSVKAAIMMTARDLGLNPFRQGAGLINIYNAYNYLYTYYNTTTNSTPPLIVTPIRAISSPMTLSNVTYTILNLTIVVGKVITAPITDPSFNVTGNATRFTTVDPITSSLNDTQVFVRISFIVLPGDSPDYFSGKLELRNDSGNGYALYNISLAIYRDAPSWTSLLPYFVDLDGTANLLVIGSIAGVATICLIGLIAGIRARRRKPEAPPDYELGWDEWPPPPPPPDWFY